MNKQCSQCKYYKDIGMFHKHSQSKDGFRPACKVCTNEANKKYPKIKTESERIRFRRYGITKEQYNSILVAQDYKCAICSKKPVKFHVDHCHKSGKIRGLLCPRCNGALGQLGDSKEALERVVEYLS